MNILEKRSWSPYAVGAGIGTLSWFAFLTEKKPIGITGAFENTAAGLGQKLAPHASGVNAYLSKSEEVPKLDWEWMLAAGVALGSRISANASGDQNPKRVPDVWAARFGASPMVRDLGAFVGGALMMIGARVAKGCTSGHAIGYCPSTSLAAVGEGRRDAIAGVLGMLAGAALFIRSYPKIKPALEAGDRGKVTIPKAKRTSPWLWIGAMAAVLGVAAAMGARQ